jgi:hypothetical protein
MPNGRCRMHGGKSTGPRTPAGFASLARARTTHGLYAQSGRQADLRALIHHVRVFDRRARLNHAAFDLMPWLPPAFAARLLADTATELHAPALGAKLQAVLTAGAPKPTDPPATLQPPGDTPHPRRDASGRFAAPPPRPLRGRQAKRAQARAEAAALAPWLQAIAHASTAMRQAQTTESEKTRSYPPAPDAEKSARARPLAQTARFANLRIHPVNPETGPPCSTPAAQQTRIEKSRTNPVQPTAALPPATPAEAAAASCAKTAIQRGTVAPPAGPGAAAGEASAETSIYRGTVTAGPNPFRNALLASTVSNTRDAHKLAATVERAGGWPIIIASDAATQAGKDWRPAATAARQRLADEAHRQRTCVDPLRGPGLRLTPEVDSVRTSTMPGDP